MINDKIFLKKDITNPSIIFLSSQSQENRLFLTKIRTLMNYPLNPLHQSESLIIYEAMPNHASLYYFISISLNTSLSESLLSVKPHLDITGSLICIVVNPDYELFQTYLDLAMPLITHLTCIYITYSNLIFTQTLFSNKNRVNFVSYDDPNEFYRLLFGLNNSNSNDNYLSKKKIFTIEKIKKDQSNCNKSLNNSSEDNSELSNNNINEEQLNNKNSLISISKEVFKFIKNKSSIQGNDVTKHIIDLLSKNGQQVKYKNIQRRVYDAINVMSAIGILCKDRGKISFIKEDKPVQLTNNTNQNQLSIFDELNQRINDLSSSIKEKQTLLIEHCSQNLFYKKFIQLNQSDHRRSNTLDKLDFPFHIITLNSESEYNIKEDDFNHRVVILSNKKFQILYPEDLIKFFVQSDFNSNNIQHFFSKEIVKYIMDNKLIETYFAIDKEEIPPSCGKRETRNSFSFGPRLFEPISILDSESNFNMYTGMDMRKGSEDNVFNTFMLMKNDELFDANENLEKNYSNYLSHSYYSKH